MSYEFRIGLLTAICIAVTVWGYKFMKGKNILSSTNYYYVEYADINELAATSPVLIRGLKVGSVSSIRLSEDMKRVIATLDIQRNIRIPKNTEALVVSTSIMGGKAVVLNVTGPCQGDECARRGDTLPGRVRGLFESLLGGEDFDDNIGRVRTGIGDILRDLSDSLSSPDSDKEFARAFQTLQRTLKHLEGITGQLNHSLPAYDRKTIAVLSNIESLSGNLVANNEKIASAIANLEAFSHSLNEADLVGTTSVTMTSAQEALASLELAVQKADQSFGQLQALLAEINEGKGSLGLLVQDKELYNNFTETSRQLSLLLQDFRLNPKRYVNVSVFGKKQREYALPDDDPAERESDH